MRHPATLLLVLAVTLYPQSQQPDYKGLCSRAKSTIARLSAPSTLTPEQEKIDVLYYRLSFTIEPDSNLFYATVLTRALATDPSISEVVLDLRNDTGFPLSLTSVLLEGNPVTYTHSDHRVSIPLTEPVSLGDTLEVTISYKAGPIPDSDNGPFYFGERNGQAHIWTLSLAMFARHWWPCKDDPSDKPDSVDIIVTVPDELIVASNGRLVSIVNNDNSTATYHWHEAYPIATYLVSLAIYSYFVWDDEYVSAANDTMPIMFFTYSDTSDPSMSYLVGNYLKTKNMISVFAELFGEYPFIEEKYGHATIGWGGGMEHQTITSLGGSGELLIAHELAHQWWGDMITCASFHHIWLNEGFGTYSEALWREAQLGTDAYHMQMRGTDYYGPGTIYVEYPEIENIWDVNLSYYKASWVLHMLRHVVGDSAFFKILKTYGSDPELKYGSATTEQFRDICEMVSGKELDQFFHQWIYGSYYPEYLAAWRQLGDSLCVSIEQTQTTGTMFHMPVDLEATCGDTTLTYAVENTRVLEHHSVPIPHGMVVTDLQVDPKRWILRTVDYREYRPFAILDHSIVDTLTGDRDGNPEPGETVALALDIISSIRSAPDVSAIIRSADEAVNVLDSTADFGPIGLGETANNQHSTFTFSVNSTAGLGPAAFDIQFYIDGNLASEEVLHVIIYSPTVAFMDGFEYGLTEWDTTEGWETTWWSHSGDVAITDSPLDYYENNQHKRLSCLRHFDLSQYEQASLVFYQVHQFASGDSGLVQLKVNDKFHTAAAFTGASSYDWTRNEVDLGTFCNPGYEDVQFCFYLKSDSAGVSDGWYLDDIVLYIDTILVAIGPSLAQLPGRFALFQNYPNPFNPISIIRYDLPQASDISLIIYDILGREITRLVDGYTEPGNHQVQWDGRDQFGRELPSGIYIARLVTPEYSKAIKMLLLK